VTTGRSRFLFKAMSMNAANDEPVFLTLDQVKELTGAGTRKTVLANLLRNGIRHTIRADGWPSVAWAAVTGTAGEARAATARGAKWKSNKAA
jgi:hypothetical protein